jgi:hypothetical protein
MTERRAEFIELFRRMDDFQLEVAMMDLKNRAFTLQMKDGAKAGDEVYDMLVECAEEVRKVGVR